MNSPVAPELPVLAITGSNTLLHVALAAKVLEHVDAEDDIAEEGVPQPDWTFFDATGRPLERVEVDGVSLLHADPTLPEPGELERRLLVDRIDAFLAAVQVLLTSDLVDGIIPEHIRVPRATGDLREVLVGLAAVMSLPVDVTEPDIRQDWLHNFGHRLFG